MTRNEVISGVPIPEYADNMFIQKLPPILSLKKLQATFDRPPLLVDLDRRRPAEERLHIVLRLLHYSQPTLAARELARRIEQMIRQGYIGRNPQTSDWARLVQSCGTREIAVSTEKKPAKAIQPVDVLGNLAPTNDTSMSTLVVGPPGVGKTHAVVTSFAQYRQVIYHTDPFVLAQIVWLRVECPPTGSLLALCRFFFAAVDTALGKAGIKSELTKQYRRASLAVQLTGMARVANLYAIGLLVIDEIQHVKVAHAEGSALLNFLVTLRNSIGIPLLLVGTMSALNVVQRTFRDARRADGLGSILFDRMGPAEPADLKVGQNDRSQPASKPIYGSEFESFVKRMWRWQYTNVVTELRVDILNAIYSETQGITDLVVKLFVLVQMQLINRSGSSKDSVEEITPELVHQVAKWSFNAVRPFVKALRENDQKALKSYEDLVSFHQWFDICVHEISAKDLSDNDDNAARLPPMILAGAIDRHLLDAVLEGMGVPARDRADMIARHGDKIEVGDISGLVAAVQKDIGGIRARDGGPKLPPRAPPVEGDVRAKLESVTDPSEIARRLGLKSLDEAGPM